MIIKTLLIILLLSAWWFLYKNKDGLRLLPSHYAWFWWERRIFCHLSNAYREWLFKTCLWRLIAFGLFYNYHWFWLGFVSLLFRYIVMGWCRFFFVWLGQLYFFFLYVILNSIFIYFFHYFGSCFSDQLLLHTFFTFLVSLIPSVRLLDCYLVFQASRCDAITVNLGGHFVHGYLSIVWSLGIRRVSRRPLQLFCLQEFI